MRIFLFGLALFFAALPAQAADLGTASTGTVIPEPNKGGMLGTSIKPDVEGDAKALKGDKAVAVPYFRIKFIKEFSESNSESAFVSQKGSVTSRVKANVKLTGFREAVLQEITDKAYADFIAKLNKKGMQTLSTEQMSASGKYAKELKSNKYPDVDDDISAYVPAGVTYPGGWTVDRGGFIPSDVLSEIKTGIISVTYNMNYVAAGKSGKTRDGVFDTSVSASIDLGQVASTSGKMSLFNFSRAKCNSMNGCWGEQSHLTLGQYPYSKIAFGTLENTTSDGEQAAQMGLKAVGFLLGASTGSSWDNYTLTVDEKKFVEASLDALYQANDRFINAL